MSDPVKVDGEPATTPDRVMTPDDISEKNRTTEEVFAKSGSSGDGGDDEPEPHLHAKTFLAVFAVCLIYFAQDFTLVGAGAVSFSFPF